MFRPYHTFTNCQILRKSIRNLQRNNAIPEDLLADQNSYHYSVYHKLKSTQHYTEGLVNLLENTPTANITLDFIFGVNRNLDGFFHCGGSALDILAREVLTYFGIPLPGDVYFQTAKNKLNQHRRNDPIICRLEDPPWKSDFSNCFVENISK